MLKEGEVVDAVCLFLQSEGYEIVQRLQTREKGDDIVAERRCGDRLERMVVEAKGQTSSDPKSKRYGKPFSDAQVRDHVGAALAKACEAWSRDSPGADVRVGMAFPDTDLHRRAVAKLGRALKSLGIAVFWVRPDRTVSCFRPVFEAERIASALGTPTVMAYEGDQA